MPVSSAFRRRHRPRRRANRARRRPRLRLPRGECKSAPPGRGATGRAKSTLPPPPRRRSEVQWGNERVRREAGRAGADLLSVTKPLSAECPRSRTTGPPSRRPEATCWRVPRPQSNRGSLPSGPVSAAPSASRRAASRRDGPVPTTRIAPARRARPFRGYSPRGPGRGRSRTALSVSRVRARDTRRISPRTPPARRPRDRRPVPPTKGPTRPPLSASSGS